MISIQDSAENLTDTQHKEIGSSLICVILKRLKIVLFYCFERRVLHELIEEFQLVDIQQIGSVVVFSSEVHL